MDYRIFLLCVFVLMIIGSYIESDSKLKVENAVLKARIAEMEKK